MMIASLKVPYIDKLEQVSKLPKFTKDTKL